QLQVRRSEHSNGSRLSDGMVAGRSQLLRQRRALPGDGHLQRLSRPGGVLRAALPARRPVLGLPIHRIGDPHDLGGGADWIHDLLGDTPPELIQRPMSRSTRPSRSVVAAPRANGELWSPPSAPSWPGELTGAAGFPRRAVLSGQAVSDFAPAPTS